MGKTKYNYKEISKYLVETTKKHVIARFTMKRVFELVEYPIDKRNYQNFMNLKTRINKEMKREGYELVKSTKEGIYQVSIIEEECNSEDIEQKEAEVTTPCKEDAIEVKVGDNPSCQKKEEEKLLLGMKDLLKQLECNPNLIGPFNMAYKPIGWRVDVKLNLVKIKRGQN